MGMSLACCGLRCSECELYLATIHKEPSLLIALAEKYSTSTDTYTKEDMLCLGCHSENCSVAVCKGCEIRSCCIKKAYTSCSECDELPCSVLEQALEHNPELMYRLKQLAITYRKGE